jgi:threonine dehydrogenase-like Zn-dependent dehydrogenase
MRAITVIPGHPGSARVEELPEPAPEDGTLLVRGRLLGVCGTDLEITQGAYGEPPPGDQRLVLGHESLGEVVAAPPASSLAPGDLVAGLVRRPDPVPCPACAAGESDMCRNDQFSERGIARRHGYGSELWRVEPEFAFPVPARLGELGVLLEPASILAKAWEQVDRISGRAFFMRERALITGAGTIGLVAALLGVQRGYEVHVANRTAGGPKQDLVEALGATYHGGDASDVELEADVVLECTGLGVVARAAAAKLGRGGIMCLTGIAYRGPAFDTDATALNRAMVLRNQVLVGTVSANRRHWEQAAAALLAADPAWLSRLITRKVPLTQWSDALERRAGDIKVVLDLGA